MRALTAEQISAFREHGWAPLGKILTDAQVEALRAEEARFRDVEPFAPNETIFRSQLGPYSQVVRDLVREPALVDVARALVGPNVAHWFNQFVTKMPDGGTARSEFPWHQDNGYAALEPANNVTIWIALDDVDTVNGCVWILPGSHRAGLLAHGAKSEDSWFLQVKVDGEGVPAVLKAGEAVVFSGLTLHRSLLNRTERARRAFFVEYVDAAAEYAKPGEAFKPVLHNPPTELVAGELPWSVDRVRVA